MGEGMALETESLPGCDLQDKTASGHPQAPLLIKRSGVSSMRIESLLVFPEKTRKLRTMRYEVSSAGVLLFINAGGPPM